MADELEAGEQDAQQEGSCRSLLERAGYGVWDLDIGTGRLALSRPWVEALGLAAEPGGTPLEQWNRRIHPGDVAQAEAALREHLEDAAPLLAEYRLRWAEGNWGWVFLRGLELTRDGAGKPQRLIATVADISERKHAEDVLRRRNRALAMLSRGNRALVHSSDEKQLLQTMCNVATEVGGYRMAWVGYRIEDAEQSVEPIAATGFEEGYLERSAISWGDNERGRGPTGSAIRTGRTCIVTDFLTDPQFLPWRDYALKRGYRSSVALPMMHRGTAFGAFTIYADHPDAFDDTEVPLLEEMAEDLAYGIMALRNNAAREQAEHDLEVSYSLLKAALESTADGIVVMALTGDAESFNQRFADMWAIPRAVMESSRIEQIGAYMAQQTRDPATFLRRLRELDERPGETHGDIIEMRDGRTLERISRPQLLNGRVIGRVSSYRDITAQRRHETQLTYLATHDALTDLPNRNLLADRLSQAIAHAGRAESHLGVLLLDLDRFKLINDSMGHEYGDILLKEVGKRLAGCTREGDTVARMGGDEFVILLPDLAREEDAAPIAAKFMEVVAQPVTVAGRELYSTASIGIALYPRDGKDASTLLKHADAAMYRGKERGGNCFQFITSEINDQITRRLTIANRLQNALARKEMSIHYQPQYDARDGRLCGAEALIRWRHPEMGMVSPAEFIPVAEETGLIFELGEWVAASVFAQQRAWAAAGLPPLKLAINVSARQLDHDELPHRLPQLVGSTGADPGRLEMEITEGMLMKHPERAERTLRSLKAMGFSIAIDDFGTGYSSLGYLRRFPIDKLKIDRSFIADVPEDGDAVAITRAIIAMAHELRLTVVAEGVETEAQMAFLREHGCDMVQGYLTGRPVPAAEFEAILGAQVPA